MTKKKDPKDLLKTGRKVTYTPQMLKKIGEDLVAWSKLPKSWHITGYACSQNKCQKWFYNIRDNHPEFQAYIDTCNRNIGNRMLDLGLTKSPCLWLLKTFLPRLIKEEDHVRSKLREEELIKAKAKIQALKEDQEELKIIIEDFMSKQSSE